MMENKMPKKMYKLLQIAKYLTFPSNGYKQAGLNYLLKMSKKSISTYSKFAL
jgi:hypothetical protein